MQSKHSFSVARKIFNSFAKLGKPAFTLAEVLITLGIIGVVAAMTLPVVVNKYQEQVTVSKVKKFYSLINQALLMAIDENGTVDEWGFIENDANAEDGEYPQRSNKLFSYFKPYLKIIKDCGNESGCIGSGTYLRFNGVSQVNYDSDKRYYKVILADGSYMWMRRDLDSPNSICKGADGGLNTCGNIWLDVNGKKPPNTIGKDTFYFVILKNTIMPAANDDCKNGGGGWGCASYILQHGNMKYLYK